MRRALWLLPALWLAVSACSRPVDLKQTLTVPEITGGWHDAGIVDGRNKIVPSVTFRIHKSTDANINPLSLNVVFKKLPRAGSPPPAPGTAGEEDWDEFFVQKVDFNGNDTGPLTVRPKAGYTGDPPQTRAQILAHSMFQDVRVHVFAKHSASQWVEIAQYDIPRRLLTD
jgi:hypothetical protein